MPEAGSVWASKGVQEQLHAFLSSTLSSPRSVLPGQNKEQSEEKGENWVQWKLPGEDRGMVLLWNESVKWVCRGFLPTRAQRHPVCQDFSWAFPGVWPQASYDTRPHLISLLCEALVLPSSWGCCGALRRWQMEHCTKRYHHIRSQVLLESSLEHGADKGNPF